jgi:hypothetical protein
VASLWFSLGTPISSTNKTDHHEITEILLKVATTVEYQLAFVNKTFFKLLEHHDNSNKDW